MSAMNTTIFSDFTVIIGDRQFACHRILLHSFQFFRDLFESTCEDPSDAVDSITLDIDPDAFQYILDVIHTNIHRPTKFPPLKAEVLDVIFALEFLGASQSFIELYVKEFANNFRKLYASLDKDKMHECLTKIGNRKWLLSRLTVYILAESKTINGYKIFDITDLPQMVEAFIDVIPKVEKTNEYYAYPKSTNNDIYNAVCFYHHHKERSLLDEIWMTLPSTLQDKIATAFRYKYQEPRPLKHVDFCHQWQDWLGPKYLEKDVTILYRRMLTFRKDVKYRSRVEYIPYRNMTVNGPAVVSMCQLANAYSRTQAI